MSKKYTRSFFVFTLSLASCAFKPSEAPRESEPSADVSPDSGTEENAPFRAEVQAQDQPHAYAVKLSWSSVPDDLTALAIRRRDDAGHEIQMDLLPVSAREYLDTNATEDTKYSYSLVALGAGGLAPLGVVELKTPKDFVVSGVQVARDVGPEFNRFFLEPGSRFVTNGAAIKIQVNEIVARGGVIESFPEGQRAPMNTNGRSGGRVFIQAKRGRGELVVYARGEQGGQGEGGGIGASGAKGSNGVDGETDSNCSAAGEHACVREYYCKRDTGDGGQGQGGGVGGSGRAGGRGGDSAAIQAEILEASEFRIRPVIQPGAAGQGGSGGPGGEGGPGGDPGRSSRSCRNAQPGPGGERGPQGSAGAPGAQGAVAPVCVRIGSGPDSCAN